MGEFQPNQRITTSLNPDYAPAPKYDQKIARADTIVN